MSLSPGKKLSLAMVMVVLAAGAVLFFFMKDDPQKWIDFVLNRNTHWALFIVLMAVLPVFGFPISVFLLLTAVKFGFILGMLLTTIMIPLHLMGSWALAKTFLYPYLEDFLKSRGYQMLHIPSNRTLFFTSLFIIIPGPPYFLKNYILALSGLKFSYYFVLSWTMELALCVPVLGLGKSLADMNFWVAGAFAALIVGGYVLSYRLKGRFINTET